MKQRDDSAFRILLAEKVGCDQGANCECRPARDYEVGELPTMLLDLYGGERPGVEVWCPGCELELDA